MLICRLLNIHKCLPAVILNILPLPITQFTAKCTSPGLQTEWSRSPYNDIFFRYIFEFASCSFWEKLTPRHQSALSRACKEQKGLSDTKQPFHLESVSCVLAGGWSSSSLLWQWSSPGFLLPWWRRHTAHRQESADTKHITPTFNTEAWIVTALSCTTLLVHR